MSYRTYQRRTGELFVPNTAELSVNDKSFEGNEQENGSSSGPLTLHAACV